MKFNQIAITASLIFIGSAYIEYRSSEIKVTNRDSCVLSYLNDATSNNAASLLDSACSEIYPDIEELRKEYENNLFLSSSISSNEAENMSRDLFYAKSMSLNELIKLTNDMKRLNASKPVNVNGKIFDQLD